MVEGTGDYRPGVCGCCDVICKAASGVTNLWRPRCRVRLAGSKAVSTAVGELRRRLLEPLLVGRPTLRSTVMLAPAARSSDPLRPWRPARNSSSKRARRDAVIWRGAYRRDDSMLAKSSRAACRSRSSSSRALRSLRQTRCGAAFGYPPITLTCTGRRTRGGGAGRDAGRHRRPRGRVDILRGAWRARGAPPKKM